ncbi:phage portal protein [Microbacterium sp. A94]|uniref:phage portal protein n=1 Tax=Microbacterium sp. A94 TaxID=3450717 RepID=UPI003F43ACBC
MGRFWDLITGAELSHNRAAEGEPGGIAIPSRDAARTVGGIEALSLGAVYRAVSIRSTAIVQLSIDVERAGELITTPSLIRRPDIDTPLSVFLERTVVSLNLAGNAYWRIRRDSAGQVNSLEVLNPHDVTIQTTPSGRISAYVYRGHDLKPADVQHLSKLRVPGSPYGLGPIQAAAAEIRGALDLRDYASGWFASGDVPSGVLSASAHLTDEQADAIRTRWTETRGGTRGVAVLGQGTSYEAVQLSPEDAQFLQSQQWNVTSIARLFGVPSSLMLAVLDGNSMTYSNVQDEYQAFARYGLADDIREIEEAFTAILPRGQRARFNVEALLRMTTRDRYSAHAVALNSGWMTPNEIRVVEGLDPIDGGDVLRAPNTPPKAEA